MKELRMYNYHNKKWSNIISLHLTFSLTLMTLLMVLFGLESMFFCEIIMFFVKTFISNTPAMHKRGCNCKKSICLKKYCECYQGGVGCSVNCRCEGCKNAFGSTPEREETKASEKNGLLSSLPTKDLRKDQDQCPDPNLSLTFSFQICRTSVQHPFSSFIKPVHSCPPPSFNRSDPC